MKQTEVIFLAEYLAKVALVLGIAFLILYPLRRQVAAVKHRVWMGLFVAAIALPVVMAFPRWGVIPSLESSAASVDVTMTQVAAPELAKELPTLPVVEPLSSVAKAESGRIHWETVFAAAWLIGALVVGARMGLAQVFLSRLKHQMRPVSTQVQGVADGLLDVLGIQREVSISVSSQVATPFVWGIRRPRVVLPADVEYWSAAELDMVLRHELAHVKRWDAASLLVSRLFFALNWVNPLAWIASRQAMKLREQACDQMVLAGGHRESDYAALLLSQAKLSNRRLLRSAAISMAERGTMEGRIRDILSARQGAQNIDHKAQRRTAAIAIVAVIAVTFFVGLAGVSQAQKKEPAQDAGVAAMEEKLDSIIIPKLELNKTPLGDAIAFLRQRSVELDGSDNPKSRGVNFVLVGYDENKKIPRITLKLSNVPLRDAVRYITDLAQRDYSIEAGAIVISGQRQGKEVTVLSSSPSAGKREHSEAEKAKVAALEKKLKTIVIPSIEFRDIPLKSAVDFIVSKSMELDAAERDVQKKGINCVLVGDPKEFQSILISLSMGNVPIGEVLRYTAELAGMSYELQPNAVVIARRTESEVVEVADQPETSSPADKAAVAGMEKKLKSIRIPSIEFVDTPLPAALQFLRQRSFELDSEEKDPAQKGVNVILGGNPEGAGNVGEYPRLTLKLSDVSLFDAFRYTASLTQMEFRIEAHAVVLSPTVKEK